MGHRDSNTLKFPHSFNFDDLGSSTFDELSPPELIKSRFTTPYINTRDQFEKFDKFLKLDHKMEFGRKPFENPRSIENERLKLERHRRREMIKKVFGDEPPPHRQEQSPEDWFELEASQQSSPHVREAGVEKQNKSERSPKRTGLADLYLTLPTQRPYKKKSADPPYEIQRMRNLEVWIDARQKEDRVVLFGDENLDENFAVIERRESRKDKLRRWKEIEQGRYFWDFIDGYKDDERCSSERKKKKETKKIIEKKSETPDGDEPPKVEEIKTERVERMGDVIAKQKTGDEDFRYLPSIYDSKPPIYRRELSRNRTVHPSRLVAFGTHIDRLCGLPPIKLEMRRWLKGTLTPAPDLPPRIKSIMSYFDEQQKQRVPSGLSKPLDELYPSLTKEALSKIREEIIAREAAEKGVPGAGAAIPTKRETQKVAGGRYTLR